jgi:hypothetical protein
VEQLGRFMGAFLWRKLLWQKAFETHRKPTGLVPTWSWISINGGVFWTGDEPSKWFYMIPIAVVKRSENIVPLPLDARSNTAPRMALQVSFSRCHVCLQE